MGEFMQKRDKIDEINENNVCGESYERYSGDKEENFIENLESDSL